MRVESEGAGSSVRVAHFVVPVLGVVHRPVGVGEEWLWRRTRVSVCQPGRASDVGHPRREQERFREFGLDAPGEHASADVTSSVMTPRTEGREDSYVYDLLHDELSRPWSRVRLEDRTEAGSVETGLLRLCRLWLIQGHMSATRAEVFDLEECDRVVVASLDSEQPSVSVRIGDETVVLPETANRAVRSLLRDPATGVPVPVIPADVEPTTQQAADLLGLSRNYVVRLIDQGSLPTHMAGTHRRLSASDVLAYSDRRASKLVALG